MANPTLHILNGPAQRDLELAFAARNLGARAKFTLFGKDGVRAEASLKILNFEYITCYGPKYKLGGRLTNVVLDLPQHNFVFVVYDTETRQGTMEFSNGE